MLRKFIFDLHAISWTKYETLNFHTDIAYIYSLTMNICELYFQPDLIVLYDE